MGWLVADSRILKKKSPTDKVWFADMLNMVLPQNPDGRYILYVRSPAVTDEDTDAMSPAGMVSALKFMVRFVPLSMEPA